MNENEGMTFKVWMRRRFYCRYGGENSKRHLEESRLNVASRSDWDHKRRGR